MDDKNTFQDMLADIVEVARVQGDRLSMEEIRTLFGDVELSDNQYEHIYAYLVANQIKIEGYVETITDYAKAIEQEAQREENEEDEKTRAEFDQMNADTRKEEDSVYLKMYLSDLEAIKVSNPKEEYELIDKILKDDHEAKTRFIEANLRYVIKIAQEYKNKGTTLEDLIQEGNIGLVSAIECLSELPDKEKWKEFIAGYVRRYIEQFIDNQNDASSFEINLIDKTKQISDAANELAEEIGREANIHELAAYTKLPMEEIQDILNMSVDTVKVGEHKHNTVEQFKQGEH